MSNAIRAQGTKIQYAGSPDVEIEEAHTIKVGGVTVSAIDASHLQSTSKEFLAGLKDNGTVDVSANFTNGPGQVQLRSDANNGVTSAFLIIMTGRTGTIITLAFSGFVTKYDGPDANVDGKLEISISLKVTGDVTLTAS